jgi:hypothetical protein
MTNDHDAQRRERLRQASRELADWLEKYKYDLVEDTGSSGDAVPQLTEIQLVLLNNAKR